METDRIPTVTEVLARIASEQRRIGEALLERCCEALATATSLPVHVTLSGCETDATIRSVAEQLKAKGWLVDRSGPTGVLVIEVLR